MIEPAASPAGEEPEGAPDRPLALRLSEVLADPVEPGVDRAYEWVELVNTAAVVVSTEGWGIGDGASVDALPAVEVPPGGFVVVAAQAAVLPVNVLVVRVPDGAIGNGLNNAGDAVRLLSPAGDVVDALSFGDNGSVFPSPPPAATAGATLGARAYGGEIAAERWAATLRPSPGDANAFAAREPSATPPESASRLEGGEPPRATVAAAVASGEEEAPSGVAEGLAPLPTRFEQESGSRTPWITLGAVAGASSVLTLAAVRGAWRASWGRGRRGG